MVVWLLLRVLVVLVLCVQQCSFVNAIGNRTKTISASSSQSAAFTLSEKTKSLSASESAFVTQSFSASEEPTQSFSASEEPTRSLTTHSSSLSNDASSTISITPPPTPTKSESQTEVQSVTHTPTMSTSPTWSRPVSKSTHTQSSTVASETDALSTSATPSLTPTVSSTITPPPTPTPTSSESPDGSQSRSLTEDVSMTESKSPEPSVSATPSASATPTNTITESIERSKTRTFSVSISGSFSKSFSESAAITRSATPNITATHAPTRSSSPTDTMSPERSISPTSSATADPTNTQTPNNTVTPTPTTSPTWMLSSSITRSVSPTSTVSLSPEVTSSTTRSVSPSGSASADPTASPTTSDSQTPTLSASSSATASEEPSRTASPTDTVSPEASQSPTTSGSPSVSASRSVTFSTSLSLSESPTTSASLTVTASFSTTVSDTLTPGTVSAVATGTLDITITKTDPSPSRSYSASLSPTVSFSISASLSASLAASMSESISLSSSTSASPTESETPTFSVSASGTRTVSSTFTSEISETRTFSSTETFSLTQTFGTATADISVTTTNTYTADDSVSMSYALTTSVQPPTTTHVPTPTFTLPTRCPEDCMKGTCRQLTEFQKINQSVFFCNCLASSATGYWRGSERGGPCDKCATGYYGLGCLNACPGGACSICSGHGVCSDGLLGTGACTCYSDEVNGYWQGFACNVCQADHYGTSCNKNCTCGSQGTCSSGNVGDGSCKCKPGWIGSNCTTCDITTNTECDSFRTCPGNGNCNGHGSCNYNFSDTGVCDCDPFYAGQGCNLHCPNSCSGHGSCDDGRAGSGVCTCNPRYDGLTACSSCQVGYYGTSSGCLGICPGSTIANMSNACSGNGECLDSGVCLCRGTWGGLQCLLQCPTAASNASLVCNGHGICDATAQCVCDQNEVSGYWEGTACEVCDSDYGGANCKIKCPVFNNELQACGANFGFGTCNSITATCDCSPAKCGESCHVDTINGACPKCPNSTAAIKYYGFDCDQVCLCENGLCNDGVGGDGTCTCEFGWSGRYCNVSCPNGIVSPCSNNGLCIQATSQCSCNASFAGPSCNIQCPSTSSGVCNGTGYCLDGAAGNGTCVCNEGWVWPETTCTTPCRCNRHGTCHFPNATCSCDSNYVGDHCEQCVSGKHGPKCDQECVVGQGKTVGYTCLCLHGFAGLNCSIACPATAAGVCNNHGTCNNLTGACKCSGTTSADGWVGPGCTCNSDVCKANNAFTICDASIGSCVCISTRSGNNCENCIFGFYGTPANGVSCTTPCDCNSNGPCDIATGVCNCFDSDTTGHWTGGTCNQCVSGYMGIKCNQLSNAITQTTDLVKRLTESSGSVTCTSFYAHLDTQRRMLYVGSSCIQARFNVATVVPFSPESIFLHETTSGDLLFGDVALLQVNISNPEELLFVLQRNSTANSFNPTLYNATVTPYFGGISKLQDVTANAIQAAEVPFAATTTFVYMDQRNGNVCAMPSGQAFSRLYCKSLEGNATAVLLIGFTYQSSAFVSDLSLLVLGGLKDFTTCTIMGMMFDASEADPEFQLNLGAHIFQSNLSTCTAVNIITAAQDLIFFSIKAPTNYIGGYNYTSRTFFKGTLIGGETQGSAMTYNVLANIGYAVYSDLVVKFEIVPRGPNQVPVINAYGQSYTTGQAIARFVQDDYLQLVYAPTKVSKGVQVLRFLLVEVHSIYPVVADRAGGALITITGKGFRNVSEARCLFDKDAVPFHAFINSTTVVCRAPQKISSEVCLSQFLEVSTNGIQTANYFSIQRPASPTLQSVEPDFIRVGEADRVVVIKGRGFRESDYYACRFVDPIGGRMELASAIYSAENYSVTCVAPTVAEPWSSSTFVHLTLDGFVFSESTLQFLFVGEAAGIVIDTPSFSVVSSLQSLLTPTLEVFSVDPNRNKLLTVDQLMRVTVVIPPNETTNGQPWILENFNVTSKNGVATFPALSIKDPPYGDFVFTVIMGSFSTNFSLSVQPGEVVQLLVTTQPQLVRSDIVIPGSSLPRPMDIVAVDAGGNAAAAAAGNRASFYLVRVHNGQLLENETSLLGSALFSATGNANVGSPVVVPTFGFPFVIFFSYDLNPLINVSTNVFYAGCPATQFFVNGTQTCQDCDDDLFTCNGTDVLVAKAQSWRSSAAAVFFYKCPLDGSCLEGGSCAEGYTGPLCGTCSEGFGKDHTNTCGQCPYRPISIVIFVAVLLFQVLFLMFVSIAFIQNWQALDSLFIQAVITLSISFSHFQFISLIGKLELGWMPLVKNCLSFLGMLFSFELHRVRAVNCLLVSNGIDAVWFAIIYSFIVICSIPILSFLVHLTLRMFPTIMLTNYARNIRGVMESRADALAKAKLVKRARNKDGSMYIKEHQRKAILLNVAQVVITFCFQTSCRSALQLFQCSEIRYSATEAKNYLTADLSVSCDTDNYRTILGYSMFLVLFYVVFIPVVFIFGVAYSRKRHSGEDYALYTSFTTLGTRDMAFFWNGLLFCRRAGLIVIELFLNYPIEGWMAMWMITFSCWAEHYTIPWIKGKHMNIERAGFMCSVYLVNLGLILPLITSEVARLVVEVFLMVGLCALFAFTLYAGLYRSLKELQQRVREHNLRDTEDNADLEVDVGLTDVILSEAAQVKNVMKDMVGQAKEKLGDVRGKVTGAVEGIVSLAKSKVDGNGQSPTSQGPDRGYSAMPTRPESNERSPSVVIRRASIHTISDTAAKPPSVVFHPASGAGGSNLGRPPPPLHREHFDDVDDVESINSDDSSDGMPSSAQHHERSAPLLNRSALSMLRSDTLSVNAKNDDGRVVDPQKVRRMELEKDIDEFIAAKGFGLYQQDAGQNTLFDTRDTSAPMVSSPIAQRSAALRALMKKQGSIPKALQDVIGVSSDDDDDSDDRSVDSDL